MTTEKIPARLITCVRCGHERPIRAREMCGACYTYVHAHGNLKSYPRSKHQVPLTEFARCYQRWREFGVRYDRDIALLLGMELTTVYRAKVRARQAGLLAPVERKK